MPTNPWLGEVLLVVTTHPTNPCVGGVLLVVTDYIQGLVRLGQNSLNSHGYILFSKNSDHNVQGTFCCKNLDVVSQGHCVPGML